MSDKEEESKERSKKPYSLEVL